MLKKRMDRQLGRLCTGALGLAFLAGCDVEVIELPNGAGGSLAGNGGAAPMGTGGALPGSGGGQVILGGTGAAPHGTGGFLPGEVGGMGGTGDDDFPWPDLPSARGTVPEHGSWDPSTTGCCSRVPGPLEHEDCPAATAAREVLPMQADDEPQKIVFGTPGVLAAFSGIYTADVNVGAFATEVPPPEGIVDLSPVFWVGTDGAFPTAAVISVARSNHEATEGEGPHIYWSEDGVEYEALEDYDGEELVGPTAYIEAPGFVVAGAGPDAIACEAP